MPGHTRVTETPNHDAETAAEQTTPTRRDRIKSGWRARMQRMAESRYALYFMCLLSFTDACCSPVLPEVLYVPMVLLRPHMQWFYAFWCSTCSVLGGAVGYGLGFWLWENGLREFSYEHVPGFTPASYQEISVAYGDNAFLWVWLGGFTPLPYKVFTVFAGVCHDQVSFLVFMTASILSRFPRIYGTVWLLDRLGKPAFDAVAKRFRLVALIVLLILLAAILYWRLR